MNEYFLQRIQACFLGVQIGDGMGAPWENKTYEEIMAETNGRGVSGFLDSKIRKIKDAPSQLGQPSDDWALTRAVALSLICCCGYDPYDLALKQLREFEANDCGWGRTTRRAFEEIGEYFDSRGARGRSPLVSPPFETGKTGAGNGVAMKIAPLLLWEALRCGNRNKIFNEVVEFGQMTHPNPVATAAAYTFGCLLGDVCRESLLCDSQKNKKISELLCELSRPWCVARKDYREAFYLLKNRLIAICENINKDIGWFREEIGTGCYAPQSVMFAIAVFLRHPTDFRAAVLEAINAGGDTDSTASMAGALVGANCGLENMAGEPVIPPEWQNFRPEYQESLKLGEEFFIAAQNAK